MSGEHCSNTEINNRALYLKNDQHRIEQNVQLTQISSTTEYNPKI